MKLSRPSIIRIVIAFVIAVIVGIGLRLGVIDFGKKSYLYGCRDSILYMVKLKKFKEADELVFFCNHREEALYKHMDKFL